MHVFLCVYRCSTLKEIRHSVTASKVTNEIIFVLKNKKNTEILNSGNIFGIRKSKVYFS
jgi:hypothetical protein